MSPPSVTLCCRLLCACGCAYYIDRQGRYQPLPGNRYGPVVAYLTPPTPISGGDDRIDACLVGENADGVIVAFRGTLPPSWQSWPSVLDWLQDLLCEPESRPNVPGMVHTGFYDATSAIIAAVAAAVKRLNPAGHQAGLRHRPQPGRRHGVDRRLHHAGRSPTTSRSRRW